jgi:hypothetical protein
MRLVPIVLAALVLLAGFEPSLGQAARAHYPGGCSILQGRTGQSSRDVTAYSACRHATLGVWRISPVRTCGTDDLWIRPSVWIFVTPLIGTSSYARIQSGAGLPASAGSPGARSRQSRTVEKWFGTSRP